jgi:hypothetical protein
MMVARRVQFGGLFEFDIVSKFIGFDVDGVLVFQGVKINVIMQFREKHAPFMFKVHCVAH